MLPRCALSAPPCCLFLRFPPAASFLSSTLSKAFVPVSLLPPFSPSAPQLFLPRPISGLFNSLESLFSLETKLPPLGTLHHASHLPGTNPGACPAALPQHRAHLFSPSTVPISSVLPPGWAHSCVGSAGSKAPAQTGNGTAPTTAPIPAAAQFGASVSPHRHSSQKPNRSRYLGGSYPAAHQEALAKMGGGFARRHPTKHPAHGPLAHPVPPLP